MLRLEAIDVPQSWGGAAAGAGSRAQPHASTGRRRGRVGIGGEEAAARRQEEERRAEELRKQMLKRPREEEGAGAEGEAGSGSESESEEETRLGMVRAPRAAPAPAPVATKKAKKSKKKKNKNKQAAAEAAPAPEPEPEPQPAPEPAPEPEPEPEPEPQRWQPPTKRKGGRKKTRSKQKNIRKDRRPLDKRPEHLRVGGKGYAGRPITPETRQRLGLAESMSSKRRKLREEQGAASEE